MIVLCVMYAVGGARIYMSMEVPEKYVLRTLVLKIRVTLHQIFLPRCHLKRRPTWQSKRRQRWHLIKEGQSLTDCLQAIIAATDYLTNSFWDKIHNPNPDKRLNETAYYEKVILQVANLLLYP